MAPRRRPPSPAFYPRGRSVRPSSTPPLSRAVVVVDFRTPSFEMMTWLFLRPSISFDAFDIDIVERNCLVLFILNMLYFSIVVVVVVNFSFFFLLQIGAFSTLTNASMLLVLKLIGLVEIDKWLITNLFIHLNVICHVFVLSFFDSNISIRAARVMRRRCGGNVKTPTLSSCCCSTSIVFS